MLRKYFFFIFLISNSFCEDVFYNINSKNVLHKVSDKFLSISIDPAVILAGVNLSDTSLLLARHLSPAFIRLAGPSTSFVKYVDNEEDLAPDKSDEAQTNVIITPSMWFGINEWFNLANLTPVFGINDDETDKGVWDSKSTLALLEMSDKFGVTCYWQLGYDCSNKTTIRYVEDLNILKQTLNGFPEHNGTWKVVGSDLSKCIYDELDNHHFENYIGDLDRNIDAIMWESFFVPKEVLGFTKSSLWTSVPKDSRPVTFSSAMEWARRTGEAAQMRYDVIFRQPRLLEITHDTPVYWFSFIHKKLMGTNVLDIKPTNPNPDVMTFAHCTKRQNNFVRAGAVTILMINNGSETSTANIRLGNILLEKSMEVQSYLLSAIDESSTEVHLNGQKLHMDMLTKAGDDILIPKLRRAKIKGLVTLETPPQSIGFFVLTGAKNVLCINNEGDLNSILTEINEDQDQPSGEVPFKIEGRRQNFKADKINTVKNRITLESIKNNILNEMEHDKSYYNKMMQNYNKAKPVSGYHSDRGDIGQKKEALHKHLKEFIEKAKLHDAPNNPVSKYQREKTNHQTFLPSNLRFTINEIEDILKRRAKAKAAAKNIRLTSAELDILVNKATIKLPKHVGKRDINRILLEEKANFHKNNMFSQEAYERYAKEKNLFPKLKFGRSGLVFSRKRRDINIPLLKTEAMLEEHKKYILDRNSHLHGDNHDHHKSVTRSRRDINLDLLKKRSDPISQNSKNRVVVQPSSRDYKNYLDEKDKRRSRPVKFSSELFKDEFDESEEQSREVSKKSRNWMEEMDNSYMGDSDFESFKTPKRKYKTELYNVNPRKNKFTKTKSSSKIKNKSTDYDSKEYLRVLQAWNEFERSYDYFPYCNHYEGFPFEDAKHTKNKKFSRLRSGQPTQNHKGKLSPIDLDEMNFSDEFEYEFYKKKRETNKEGVKLSHHETKSGNYVKMDNGYLINRTQVDDVEQNKVLEAKDIVNASEKHFETKKVREISEENSRKVKRSLMGNNLNSLFGQYQPLTAGLRPWKPIDILGLQNSYFRTLPAYNWIQEQNLKNTLLQNKYLLGLRRKRYILNNDINSIENEILSDEYETDYKDKRAKSRLVKIPQEKSFVGEMIAKKKNHYLENQNKKNDIETKLPKMMIQDMFEPESVSNSIVSSDKSIEEVVTNENHYQENQNKTTDNETKLAKSKTQEKSESVVDSMVSSNKLTYLERVLGKKNAKPIEDFAEKVKQSFNSMNRNISTFFKKLF